MIARALTQRWPIKQEYRQAIVAKLMRVIADPSSSPREITAAAKALMAAEKQNQEDEHKVIDVEIQRRNTELDAIAADLGITLDLIEDATGQGSCSYSRIEESTDDTESHRKDAGKAEGG